MLLHHEQKHPFSYAAYLVRLWQDSDGGPWRASAQSAHTGDIQLFAGLDELFVFLEGQTVARIDETIDPSQPS